MGIVSPPPFVRFKLTTKWQERTPQRGVVTMLALLLIAGGTTLALALLWLGARVPRSRDAGRLSGWPPLPFCSRQGRGRPQERAAEMTPRQAEDLLDWLENHGR